MKINERSKFIINELIKRNTYVTASEIADLLQVSIKTVTRQLVNVEKILNENDLILERKTSKGMQIKLYVFNCGHAATAYFGYHNNCETIHDALEVPEIKADVVAVMKESAMVMTKKYPFKFEELEAYIEKILKRISLEALHDEVVRVGRSPIRKLNLKDRLVGPALLAESYGLDNTHLAKAIATGYTFDYKEDEQAVEIQAYIADNGIEKAVEKYSGLTADQKLYQLVIENYKAIKA